MGHRAEVCIHYPEEWLDTVAVPGPLQVRAVIIFVQIIVVGYTLLRRVNSVPVARSVGTCLSQTKLILVFESLS